MNELPENDYHPIYDPNNFHINTPMIDELAEQLQGWLWRGGTGGVIYGGPRYGKSRAARAASRNLVTRTGQPIPVRFVTMAERDNPTVANVYRSMIRSVGLEVRKNEVADGLADAMLQSLAEMSMVNDTRQVVLIVDEAQYLKKKQLSVFCELHNKLIDAKISLSVFFFANVEESMGMIKEITSEENGHLHGRFFRLLYPLSGLRTPRDVRYCLREYDHIRYPSEDGPTVTEYFLPELYNSGWRLEVLTEVIWSVFQDQYKSPLRLKSWPVQYFTSAISMLLVDYLPRYGADDSKAVEDMVTKCVDASGLVPAHVSWTPC